MNQDIVTIYLNCPLADTFDFHQFCRRLEWAICLTILHDGLGLWLLARRLHEGRFKWTRPGHDNPRIVLSDAQLQALLVGLHWQTLESDITVL